MNLREGDVRPIPICRATLNYASRDVPGGGVVPIDVDIADGRTAPLPPWNECGFELVEHVSTLRDWTDDDQVAAVHYGEAEALAHELTGCPVALVSDHIKRRGGERGRREQPPVSLVHSDFAPGYDEIIRRAYRGVHGRGARTLARAGVTPDDIAGARRIVMLQLWRNVGSASMDYPVAWCDARTVTPEESRPFRYNGYVAGGFTFDALAILAPLPNRRSDHAWYSYPGLTADEVIAFRTYDTDLVRYGATHFTPHSAFRDPYGDQPRFSIELRVMCLFPS